MARVIADKMLEAGIKEVVLIGGSPEVATTLGLSFLADAYPDEGPLCGLITAMRAVKSETLCVLPCDVPQITSRRIEQLVTSVTTAGVHDVAVLTSSQDHWLCSAWRVRTCLPVLTLQFDLGERAIHRVVKDLNVQRVFATDQETLNFNSRQQALGLEPFAEAGD